MHRKNTRRKPNPRKTEFRAALALNGETFAVWAEKRGVKAGHLSHVLSGLRESGRLDREIDAYVADFRARVSTLRTATA